MASGSYRTITVTGQLVSKKHSQINYHYYREHNEIIRTVSEGFTVVVLCFNWLPLHYRQSLLTFQQIKRNNSMHKY